MPYVHESDDAYQEELPLWPTEDELLIGYDWSESYEGSCCLLFKRNGVLYEVQNSHCSCNSYSEDSNIFKDQSELDRHIVTGAYLRAKKYWASQLEVPEAKVLLDQIMENEA